MIYACVVACFVLHAIDDSSLLFWILRTHHLYAQIEAAASSIKQRPIETHGRVKSLIEINITIFIYPGRYIDVHDALSSVMPLHKHWSTRVMACSSGWSLKIKIKEAQDWKRRKVCLTPVVHCWAVHCWAETCAVADHHQEGGKSC
jgi:hypothetical protein